jgi:hypothetical protein
MVTGPAAAGSAEFRRTVVASHAKMPGTEVSENDAAEGGGAAQRTRARSPKQGRLTVSELALDRAAAPSPFGDDLTFPLPLEDLTYTPTTTP